MSNKASGSPYPENQQVPMPAEIPTRVVDLGQLKPRPKRTALKRVGIVPRGPEHVKSAPLQTGDGFQFPANSDARDTNVTFHGGNTAGGVTVQLIFWGADWNGSESGRRLDLINAAKNVIDGPYYSALYSQYNLARPVFGGSTMVNSQPPAIFADGDIQDFVWNLIDLNIFPEPDDPGGRNFYCVFMPKDSLYGPGDALGAHSWPGDYDFPADFDTAWVAWIGHDSLDTMTRAFAHELAETVTDPEGDGWHTDVTGDEIGDICNSQRTFCKGVFVEGYWAKNSKVCVVPQCPEVVSAVVRSADHLDVFAPGTNGAIFTAAWEPDYTDGWHGWWPINGGIAAPGSAVFGVSKSPNRIDLFCVGTDLGVYTAAWEPDFPNGWQGWFRLDNNFTVAPGTNVHAVSRDPGFMDIFAIRGDDFGICTRSFNPNTGWSPWTHINTGIAAPGSSVYAVSRRAGTLDAFAVSRDHTIITATLEPDGWHGWAQVSNGIAAPGTSVFPVSRSLDHLDVFAVGTNHAIFTAAWQPSFGKNWSGWAQINGGVAAPGTSVFGVSRGPDKLDIFAVGTNHGIFTAAWQPSFPDGWRGWLQINGGFAAPGTSVFPVSRSLDHLDIFAIGTDFTIFTAAWQPSFTDGWHGWLRILNGKTTWGL